MSSPHRLASRSDRFAEAVCVCIGFAVLAMVWSWAASAWFDVRALPAVPWVLAVAAAFCAVHLRTRAQRERVAMRRPALPAWAVAAAVPAFMMLKCSVEALLPGPRGHGGGDPVHGWLASGGGWAPIVLALVLVVPLAEETIFRGMMMPWLERRFGPFAAVVGSGVAFALVHFNPAGLPSFLMGGLVLSYAAHASRSLWVSILLHAAANATMVLSVAGVPFGVRAAHLLLLPSAAVLAWLGFRFRPAHEAARPHAVTGAADLAPTS